MPLQYKLVGEGSFGIETSRERREGDNSLRLMEQKENEGRELRNNEGHVR